GTQMPSGAVTASKPRDGGKRLSGLPIIFSRDRFHCAAGTGDFQIGLCCCKIQQLVSDWFSTILNSPKFAFNIRMIVFGLCLRSASTRTAISNPTHLCRSQPNLGFLEEFRGRDLK
ncbi:hypothetical protein KO516_06610, partial [Citreicella sp. C3M06]|uniref:hypothetical protein n=1 Tax=Citreicella sp. C3M06 TaxID=2841564 RepID=UPI001C0A6720